MAPQLSSPASAQIVGTYATGMTAPSDLAWDSSGNLFVSGNGGLVYKVGPGGSPVTVFASGFNHPFGLEFGASGDLFVSDRTGIIWKVATNGSKVVFATGLADPTWIHFDDAGNLFVAEWSVRNLKRVSPTGVVTMYAPLLGAVSNEVGDFTILPSGIIEVGVGNDIKRVGIGGSPVTTIAAGLGACYGMRRNGDGSFFVTRGPSRDIWYVSPSGVGSCYVGGSGCADGPIAIASFFYPDGVRVHDGVLYIADHTCRSVRRFNLSEVPMPTA